MPNPIFFLVSGRSIDGTIYAFANGDAWSPSIRDADIFSHAEGSALITQERALNRHRELDRQIGHLTLLPLTNDLAKRINRAGLGFALV